MKTAYKKAMDQVTVSDHMRTRILAAAARPKNRYGWVKTACGAAACFALLCTVGLAGLQGMENSKLALPETAAKFGAADAPCTSDGYKTIFAYGKRLPKIFIISCNAAPCGEVIIPIVVGRFGIGFFFDTSKSPSFESFSFNCSKAIYKAPIPSGSIVSA